MRHKVGAVLFILLILLSGISPTVHAMMVPVTYSVRGKVIDRQSRQPVAYANVFVAGIPGKGASTDSLGTFKIEQVPPGIYSLEASCIGYQTVSTPEYIVSASTPFIEIEMEEDANLLNTVVVVPSPSAKYRKPSQHAYHRLAGNREKVPEPTGMSRASYAPIPASLSLPSAIATT